MKITPRKIKTLIDQKRPLRSVNPFKLTAFDINTVVDEFAHFIITEASRRSPDSYEESWVSIRKLKKSNKNIKLMKRKFKHINRYNSIINQIVIGLDQKHTIEIRHTENKGPEYNGFIRKAEMKRTDWVAIPHPIRFKQKKIYYKTILHELGHASAGKCRLCLKLSDHEEEIVVELAALIISFLSGYNVIEDTLNYITNWSYTSKTNGEEKKLWVDTRTKWNFIFKQTKRLVRYMLLGSDRVASGTLFAEYSLDY